MNNIIRKILLMIVFTVSNAHLSLCAFESTQRLNFEYDFTSKHPHIKLNKGFFGFEKWGTWTNGENASLSIDWEKIILDEQNNNLEDDYSLIFLTHAYLPSENSKVNTEFTLSDSQNKLLHQTFYDFSSSTGQNQFIFSFKGKDLKGPLNLDIKIKGCSAPAEHSSSKDKRLLGLGFRKIVIEKIMRRFLKL